MQFQILGPLQVYATSAPLPVQGPREQKILAMLILNADQPVSVERLVRAVWDDAPPETAAVQVRNRISRLRRSWRRVVTQPETVLRTEANGYLLQLDGHDLDLREFEQHVSGARVAGDSDDRAEAVRRLRAALGCWRGPALYGIGGEAVAAAATLLEERRLQVTAECLGHELALGRHHEIIVELAGLVSAHPLREWFSHHLMLALYRAGRQADALAEYQRFLRTIRDELGLDPSPQLEALHEAILRHSPEFDRPGGIRPHLVVAAGPAATTRPRPDGLADPNPPTVRPAEIPADIIDFTEPVRELEALDAQLPDPDGPLPAGTPIIAITGTAGVGKTALAVHWAHRVTPRFPDGQLHVDLRGCSTGSPLPPVEALATMLRALGVEQGPADSDEAARLLRSLLADKRMLLMLDDAESAEQVRPLLPGRSGCLVLITSRNRLDGLVASHGARRLTVDPLSEDRAVELLARMLGPHRIADEREAAARLAHACAELPLALRIAAANLDSVPDRSIATYVDELDSGDRLAALRIVDDSPAVESAFDASYTGLPAPTRRVFRLLGLAPGPDIGPDAVSALTGLESAQVSLVMARLTAAHLVQPNGPDRFTAHALLRLYMKQRTVEEDEGTERTSAMERLLHWYLDHARAAAGLLFPDLVELADPADPPPTASFESPPAARAWLDAEYPNLLAAIETGAADGPHSVAWRLVGVLCGYFRERGLVPEWLRAGNLARVAAAVSGDLRGQVVAHLSLALAHHSRAGYRRAVENARAALALSTDAGWAQGQQSALSTLRLAETLAAGAP